MSQDLATVRRMTAFNGPGPLRVGQEVWTDYPHRLDARVRVATRRGEVREVSRWELPGVAHHVALVLRLKPRPTWRTRARFWALLGPLGVGVALSLGWAVWTARWWLLLLAAGWVGVKLIRRRIAS
jgi:hypothetical protein